MANVLSDETEAAGSGAGATGLVAAADRSGDRRPSGDGERVPARRGDRGAGRGRQRTGLAAKTGHQRRGCPPTLEPTSQNRPPAEEVSTDSARRMPPAGPRAGGERVRAVPRADRRGRRAAAATRWRSGRTWSTTTASRPGTRASRRFVARLRGDGAAGGARRDRDGAGAGGAGRLRRGADGARPRRPASTGARGSSCLTLGYSRKSVRLLAWKSSSRVWAELHERAFRRLGGAPRVVVLDNLREGVLTPDIYDPALNPLYRDVLAHYGVVALPCRVRDPDRKGKVESGVGHAQKTPLAGTALRDPRGGAGVSRSLGGALGRHAHPRHDEAAGRRDVCRGAAASAPLPVEPFRYYQYGERTVHLDGCVEVDAAYYGAPPGWIGRRVPGAVGRRARAAPRSEDRRSCCASTCARSAAAIASSTRIDPRARRTTTEALLRRARGAGQHVGAVCDAHPPPRGRARRPADPRACSRCAKKHGAPAVDDAAKAALDLGAPTLPLPAALPRAPPAGAADAAPGRSAHPPPLAVPRPHPSQNRRPRMNLVELDHALRKLRLSGMAAVLETRLRHAQTERLAPIDLVSTLVSDELLRRQDRLLARRIKHARLPRRRPLARHLRLRLQQEDEPRADLRARHRRASSLSARTCCFLGPPGTGKSHLAQAIGRAAIQQGHRVLYREAHVLIEEIADADARRHAEAATSPTWPPSRCSSSTTSACASSRTPPPRTCSSSSCAATNAPRTLLTSNRPVDDWGKLLGDTAAVTALLDRLLHHAHVLKCGPRSWRTKVQTDLRHEEAAG